MARNVQVRPAMDAVVTKSQRTIVTTPEGERRAAWMEYRNWATLKTSHKATRLLARRLHRPTLTQLYGVAIAGEGCPLGKHGDAALY
jgi:hypothetical protein